MITLNINGESYEVKADPDEPLLWVVREKLGLTGTKFGCGQSLCGVCTMLVDGEAIRSCVTSVDEVVGKKIITIEGLADDHPVKNAWIEDQVPQCGYCHSGQIMGAVALLDEKPQPTDADIDDAMSGIVCRCGTYNRIRRAIHNASKSLNKGGKS